ncbi:tyrosine-type recombinase/integrase [Kitasatospora sp. NPDC001527]|uniref:tyrosine-type recombinase/integrase n=1 Tax=Kitasatospora sp. NPDC001527 TaxID=3154519 RepID=UPI003316E636
MRGTGTIYKRCGCRDSDTGRQLGSLCPDLHRRGHGSWYLAMPRPATVDDHRSRLRRGGYRTRKDAAEALQRLRDRDRVRQGELLTTGQWLLRWYSTVEPHLRPSTARGYRKHLEQYLVPLLGHELLCELTNEGVQQAFSSIVRRHQNAGQPISAGTLRRIQATLRAALNVAVRNEMLTTNPARHLDLPRAPRPHPVVWTDGRVAEWERTGERPLVAVWTPTQTAAFLAYASGHRLYALYHLYALRGLRRGEGVGLRWSDFDASGRTLTVARQLQQRENDRLEACPVKTRAGERTIALDGSTVRILNTHRNQQRREKLAAGIEWNESGYVFTDVYGSPLRPDHVGHVFQGMVRRSGLPPVRLHDLRHGAASLALTGGSDLKVIQAQLGHSTIVTTADTYTSVLPETAHLSAEATARVAIDAARMISRGIRSQPKTRKRRSGVRPAAIASRRIRSSE